MEQVEKASLAWTSAAVLQGLAGQQEAVGQASLAVEPETAENDRVKEEAGVGHEAVADVQCEEAAADLSND